MSHGSGGSGSHGSGGSGSHGSGGSVSRGPAVTVRLVGGDHTYQGRVEVFYDGSWLAVCDDNWDSYEARVVCRQLGFPYDNAQAVVNRDYDQNYYEPHFGQGSGQMWLTDFVCGLGNNNLHSCGHMTSGSCDHRRDVGVICKGKL